MSQFDRENQELFQMVRNNHHRAGTTTTVGIIVPIDQARSYAEFEVSRRKGVKDRQHAVFFIAGLFVAVCGFVIPLVF